jgi:hypothetical protein
LKKSLVIHKNGSFCWITKENSDEVLMKMDGHDYDVLAWLVKKLELQCTVRAKWYSET